MKIRPVLVALSATTIALTGCSSSSKGTSSNPASPGADGGDAETYLAVTKPTDGFWVKSKGTTIAAGGDEEYCEVQQLPGSPSDTYYVKSIELGNGNHSHHLIVTAAEPGGVAEKKMAGLANGEHVACLSGQQAFGEVGSVGVHGIQAPYGRLDFPSGIGRIYHGGQRIVFDYHYFNPSTEAVQAQSVVAMHLTTAGAIEHIADGFGFYNWTIDTPPGKTGKFKAECTFDHDVMASGVTRHTHKWGKDYSVWWKGGADDGNLMWTSTDWQHDVDHPFDAPRLMKAGEGFEFECNYDNTENHDLRFGTQASDEMCILFGLIWSPDQKEPPKEGCNITWTDSDGVGHSTKADGGFPKPSKEEAALCSAGSAQGGAALDACAQCRCDSCATPIVKCAADTECQAVLDCFGKPDCDVQSAVDEHSSAAGMLQQMQGCIQYACPVCAPADGGQ